MAPRYCTACNGGEVVCRQRGCADECECRCETCGELGCGRHNVIPCRACDGTGLAPMSAEDRAEAWADRRADALMEASHG